MSLSTNFFTIIFIELAVGIFIIGLILSVANHKATQRAKMREVILQKQTSSFGNSVWFPIRYSSRKHFQSIWKFFVWEKSGIMFLDKEAIFFVPETQSNHSLVFDLSSSEILLNWIDKPNGLMYWFSIMSNGETHYFTSETGTFISTTKKTTKDIYNKLQEHVKK